MLYGLAIALFCYVYGIFRERFVAFLHETVYNLHINLKKVVSNMANNKEQFAVDTSKRTPLQWVKGLLVLLIGLTIAHLGVTLFLISEMGSDTFTIFVQGLANTIGISIGTCHVAACVVLMVTMLLTTKGYVKPGTVVCAFCGGWIIDLFLWVFGDMVTAASPIVLRLAVMVLGCIILSFGMSIVISSNSGTGPNDLVAIIMTDKINLKWNVQFRWVRMACDVLFIVLGVVMGGTSGVGTVAAAFLTGPAVQFFLPISSKLIKKVCPDL